MKTSELTDIALDWAVTMIEKPEACEYGVEDWRGQRRRTVKNGEYVYRWHQSWAQGGPIIEREGIDVHRVNPGLWSAKWWANNSDMAKNPAQRLKPNSPTDGPTPRVAAMRCFVAAKLGHDVDVPEELCQPTA